MTATSSWTLSVDTPPITGTSLVPWMVTVTSWLAVPSNETAVKLSVIVLAGAELLDRPSRPLAALRRSSCRGSEREGAVAFDPAVAAWGVKLELAGVDVGDGQAPSAVRLPAVTATSSWTLSVVRHPADHRHVVGAVDGDGDQLAGGAVRSRRR